MRLRPLDLEIPADNPFANDALERTPTYHPTRPSVVTIVKSIFSIDSFSALPLARREGLPYIEKISVRRSATAWWPRLEHDIGLPNGHL